MAVDAKAKELAAIENELESFDRTPLYAERKRNRARPVAGEGAASTAIVFVGEAPGKSEASAGRPFCGASGKVLDELLESAGLRREEVFITNLVKDRPPNNRVPTPSEIAAYSPFLDRQLEIIRPKVVAALGRTSAGYLLKKYAGREMDVPIGRLHGRAFDASAPWGKFKVVPLFHPAVAVYDAGRKSALKRDMKSLKYALQGS